MWPFSAPKTARTPQPPPAQKSGATPAAVNDRPLPLHGGKFARGDGLNAFIYTVDNLDCRGVKPHAVAASWSSPWALESVLSAAANGHSVGDLMDTGAYTVSFFARVARELIARGLAGPHRFEDFVDLGETGGKAAAYDVTFEKVLATLSVATVKDAVQRDLIAGGEWLGEDEYWAEMKRLVIAASETHRSSGRLLKQIHAIRPYEAALIKPLEVLQQLGDLYLYLHGCYRIADGPLLLHACCLGGNHALEIHADGTVRLPLRGGLTVTADRTLRGSLEALFEQHDVAIHETMTLPYDLQHLVNDYDALFVHYTRGGANSG